MFDWQSITVTLIVLVAAVYVARRAFSRYRSFAAIRKGESSCASGCGKCGEAQKAVGSTTPAFVQINSSRPISERHARRS